MCSLENAGENSVLPMLRSVRLVLGLLSEGKSGSLVYSCDGVDAQVHSETPISVAVWMLCVYGQLSYICTGQLPFNYK